eukprot:CAMPEP_0175824554 /NCGR_PEP_ID=MMETSP0107_2-20121207/10787_1 /TAXON_ID=195067 ORGANISM="Goniomonas pacifica, Strain CCMP1869" /NCGR_SAMPLE_ID=MMETSP0107_2 /ASSEMBLY_ACC=CAM_ASM_000203 /LENGTH=139 /DNA_ID=CAMNT_0017137121 /DNA_START=356 /DNA_END=775 /DNA_ORIENTATION=-
MLDNEVADTEFTQKETLRGVAKRAVGAEEERGPERRDTDTFEGSQRVRFEERGFEDECEDEVQRSVNFKSTRYSLGEEMGDEPGAVLVRMDDSTGIEISRCSEHVSERAVDGAELGSQRDTIHRPISAVVMHSLVCPGI